MINLLTSSSNQDQINAAANALNIQIESDSDFTSLWSGDKFLTKFCTDIETLINELNEKAEIKNAAIAERKEKAAQLENLLVGADDVVALDQFGEPAFIVKTNAKSGERVCVSNELRINPRFLKVSRSKRNFQKAKDCEFLSAKLDEKTNSVFYY